MNKQAFEGYFERSIIGVVLFIGFVSLFYSWIDSVLNININVYLLALIAVVVVAAILYLISVFDRD